MRYWDGGQWIASFPIASSPAWENPKPGTEHRTRRRLILATAAGVVAALVAVVVLVVTHHQVKPAAIGGPTLDGTYRLVYDDSQRTKNGATVPLRRSSDKPDLKFWAFRSRCTAAGCVATGTQLDPNKPTVALTAAAAAASGGSQLTSVLHFADGHWSSEPARVTGYPPTCLSGDTVGPGSETVLSSKTFSPQPDGTFNGVAEGTFLTNGCGHQGSVDQMPFVASRTGDVPAGVAIADPAEVPVAATATSTPPSTPAGSPVLNGVYRITFDNTQQTKPLTGDAKDPKKTWADESWAFRSECSSTRCVATGASLAETNQREASGVASVVLEFIDGRWQSSPPGRLLAPDPCPLGAASDQSNRNWSVEPEPEGTLRGVQTDTVVSDQCGLRGSEYTTPMAVTRTGDVPPAVILADPSLFLS